MDKPVRLVCAWLMLACLLVMFSAVQAGTPGDFDTSFSQDGFDSVRTGSLSHGSRAVALQPDGKIVVAGDQQNKVVVLRYLPNGTLDSTFSGDGIVTTNFTDGDEDATAVAIQPDGKIIVVGVSDDYELIMARYLPNGKLDRKFATNGKYVSTVLTEGATLATGIILLPDGKFIISATFFGTGSLGYDFMLVRFKPNGKIDTNFGDEGVILNDFVGAWDFTYDIVQQPDGKLIQVGTADVHGTDQVAATRYHPNGELDNDFGGGDGTLELPFASDGAAVVLLPDGKILIGGTANNSFLLAQLLSNGNPDSSFGGGDGFASYSFGGVEDTLIDLVRLPDGKIIAVGRSFDGDIESIAIARFDNTGAPDLSFSEDAQILLNGGDESTFNEANAVTLQTDGKIVVIGKMDIENETHIYTARLHNETLRNADFEQNTNGDKLPDYWKGKKLSNDTLMCDKASSPAFSGSCVFRLRGDADGKRERLMQDFNVAGMGGDEFTLSAYIESNNLPADSARLSIEFWSGKARINRGSIPVVDLNSDGYMLVSGSVSALGIYDKVRVSIELKATSGRLLADSLTLTQTGTATLEAIENPPNSSDLRMSN